MGKSVFDFDANMQNLQYKYKNLKWINAKDKSSFGLFGSNVLNEDGFCRLSKAERDTLTPINTGEAWLSQQSAGIQIKFKTNSTQIFVRGKNASPFDMTNMTQIGECGADLYVYDEEMKQYVLHEVVRIYPINSTTYELPLGHFSTKEPKERKYVLNLALYMAVEQLYIGVDEDALVSPVEFSNLTKVAVYGTSITQGCSASRPGMASTNYLSRKLDMEIFNYGFSGQAMMEKEVGSFLGDRNIDILLVDAEPNAGVDKRMEDNAPKFLDEFLRKRPNAKVVLFSRILMVLDKYDDYRIKLREYYKKYLKNIAKEYREKGYEVYFADGSKTMKGNYTELFSDGIHPTDIGMVAIANSYEREIKKLLK